MKTNFKISEDLTLRKIETLSIPKGIFSFQVASCNEVNVELALKSGEMVFISVKLAPNIFSTNRKIQCVKVAKDTVYLVETNAMQLQKNIPLGKLEIEGVVHKFSYVEDCDARIIIENGDKFFAVDVTGKKLPKFSVFQNCILLKFNDEIQIISFDSDYKLLYTGKFSEISEIGSVLKLNVRTETQEGYLIVKSIEILGKIVEEKTVNFEVLRKNNFNDTLFPIVFFERLKYLDDREILKMMTSGFALSDIPKLKKFIGDFEEVILVEKTCVLNYGDHFRSFTLKFKNNLVDNILEI